MVLSDEKIMLLIQDDGSFDKGFELLVRTHQEKLYWHIRRIVHIHEDADDVLQNTFIKVFKNIKGFSGKSKLYTWLYRIATNEAITHINKQKKKAIGQIEGEAIPLENMLKADQYFDENNAQLLLKMAIEQLPEKQRAVFNMRYYDEMSYKDISESLETSVGALKASFHHAIKKIENYLEDNMDYVYG